MPTTVYKFCSFCDKEIQEDLEKHRSRCGRDKVDCEYNCGLKIARSILKQHMEESCVKRKSVCRFCLGSFQREEMGDHLKLCSEDVQQDMSGLEGDCSLLEDMATHSIQSSLFTCASCSTTLRRGDLEEHGVQCKVSILVCGKCETKVDPKEVDNHLKEKCVKCVTQCVFCDKDVDENLMAVHYKLCKLIPVRCGNKCGNKLPRKEIPYHMEEDCPKRMVECVHCTTKVEARLLANHHSECGKFPVQCLENCGVIIPRGKLPKHLDEECKKLYTHCIYKKLSCKFEGFPADLRKHLNENIGAHMELMNNQIEKLEGVVVDLQKTVNQLLLT